MSLFNNSRINLVKKTLSSVLFILFVSILITACGDNSALVGKWEHESGPTRNKPETLELSKSGIGACDGVSISWKVQKGQLIISTTVFGTLRNEAFDYKVSGSELTLFYNDGTSATFSRE